MSDLPACSDAAIVISATFTAEPLSPGLSLVLQEAGLALHVRFSPYHQVLQELLSPTSVLATNSAGVNVVLLRVEDFVREIGSLEEARAIVLRMVGELSEALAQHARRVKVPTVFAVLPPSPGAKSVLVPNLEAASSALIEHARRLPGIALLSAEEIDLVSSGERYDRLGDELAHMPFTDEHY